jgi:hypothetical protein
MKEDFNSSWEYQMASIIVRFLSGDEKFLLSNAVSMHTRMLSSDYWKLSLGNNDCIKGFQLLL